VLQQFKTSVSLLAGEENQMDMWSNGGASIEMWEEGPCPLMDVAANLVVMGSLAGCPKVEQGGGSKTGKHAFDKLAW
jgi:hypothetical protein